MDSLSETNAKKIVKVIDTLKGKLYTLPSQDDQPCVADLD